MLLVKGTFQNGVIHLDEPVDWEDGQSVVITLVEANNNHSQPMDDAQWDEFERIIEECQVDTGIEDLAHQHDHYIHGTPKREPYP